MAYPAIPRITSLEPGTQKAENAIKSLLTDIASRKEFRAFTQANTKCRDVSGYGMPHEHINLVMPGLRLHGAQLFMSNFENPDTQYTRLLIEWQTGTGKSIVAASIGHRFIQHFKRNVDAGESVSSSVFVISFTARETIQEDMLKHPEFGFVSLSEIDELKRLRHAASVMGPNSMEAKQMSDFTGTLRRRITDRSRGGYYQFYGYKEFANRLFNVTKQGLINKFDIQTLYRNSSEFGIKLSTAVKNGDVIVNDCLLEELKGGLLIADEIHNVYNIMEKNNYGIAIQYALDALGDSAPRVVLMSATPMTGSAAEVIDLLNLLVPKKDLPGGIALRREDFFIRSSDVVRRDEPGYGSDTDSDNEERRDETEYTFVVSQLLEGAIEKIGHLAAGRVSFLLDSDVGVYPKRIFEGDTIDSVPYLKFMQCDMSPFHERTLERELGDKPDSSGLPANAYTLYDMVFPNPMFPSDYDGDSYGLYRSRETPTTLKSASEDWKAQVGVYVEKTPISGTFIVGGTFLDKNKLSHYSTKYDRLVKAVLDVIKSGPGKIMIYHHRVRMSGVLLIQEVLKMHGLIDESSAPGDNTLCGVCGTTRLVHDESLSHTYTPARFIVAHSDIERPTMVRGISKFNAISNVNGYEFRIMLGSKIIREGLNFKAVRFQFVASLPTDFPTLIQVFGRVVRKDSHADLPKDQRDVRIRIFVSTRKNGRVSPELQRYINKGKEYVVIQEVERALRKYAVDAFVNMPKINTVLKLNNMEPGLDAIPYKPLIGPDDMNPTGIKLSTFETYGHGDREVAIISGICRVLFKSRPVWTYEDLWAAVKSGVVHGANYNPELYDEGNFALALESLSRPYGSPASCVTRVGIFYVISKVTDDGTSISPLLDIESYLREPPHRQLFHSDEVVVKLSDYMRGGRSARNFETRIREFERDYLYSSSLSTPEISLLEYSASFHYSLLRKMISQKAGEKTTINDERVMDVYLRFRIAVTVADATGPHASRVFRGAPGKTHEDIIGYVSSDEVVLWDPDTLTWYSASHSDFSIGRRQRENDIIVGFVVSNDDNLQSQHGEAYITNISAKFKIRPPAQTISHDKKVDSRTLIRGAVCETRPREELQRYVDMLREEVLKFDLKMHQNPTNKVGGFRELQSKHDYTTKYDKSKQHRFPSAISLCDALKLNLLALEENARSAADGMTNGIRYLYLFNDKPPSITAVSARK